MIDPNCVSGFWNGISIEINDQLREKCEVYTIFTSSNYTAIFIAIGVSVGVIIIAIVVVVLVMQMTKYKKEKGRPD